MRGLLLGLGMLVALHWPCHAENFKFDFEPPANAATLKAMDLWSTQYIVHSARAQPAGGDAVELRKRNGGTGISLRRSDWCNAVMEGTVAVLKDDKITTFNVDGLQDEQQVDCSFLFHNTAPNVLRGLSRQVFAEVSGARVFGLGINGYRLVPYRTIATDPSTIATGTVLYIAGLKGRALQLPDGSSAKHDGYVFAGDRGGSILGNHIDFFTGLNRSNPAPQIVTSSKTRPFKALIVTDAALIADLKALHLQK